MGELAIPTLVPACHRVLPFPVSSAMTFPYASPVNVKPESVVSTPAPEPVPDPSRYAGRYQDRVVRNDVVLDDDGRLWLTRSDRNEALAMVERAGMVSESERNELRRLAANTFVTIDDSGAAARTVEFVGTDADGRARLLHTGRAVPRVE